MAANSIKLLTGNSHPELAQLVADRYVLIVDAQRSFHYRTNGYIYTTGSALS